MDLSPEKFTEKALGVLQSTIAITRKNGHAQAQPAHLLAALLQEPSGLLPQVLRKCQIASARVEALATAQMARLPRQDPPTEPQLARSLVATIVGGIASSHTPTIGFALDADESATRVVAGDARCTASGEGVNHRLAGAREPPDQTNHELERLWAGVDLACALVDLGRAALKMDAVTLDDPVYVSEAGEVRPIK